MSRLEKQLQVWKEFVRDHPELLEETPAADGGTKNRADRPQLKLPTDDRELDEFAAEIGAEAVKTRLLFRRDTTPVVVNAEKKRLDAMTPGCFQTWISPYVACYREKVIGDCKVRRLRTMNVETARGVLESMQFWKQLPEIERLNPTRLPVLSNDGCIELLLPGYSIERRIFTLDDGIVYDDRLDLHQARNIIDDLRKDFPWANPRSEAAHLAAMLTMFCAAILPKAALRPAFIATANSPGAGKTLAMKFAIIPIVGSAAPRTLPRDEEARKVLDVIAKDGESYVLFDNIRGKIKGPELESFITSAYWDGRVLGESTKFRVPNVTTVFMTGNQSTTSEDIADRCLFIELFVQQADHRDRIIPRIIDDGFLSNPAERSRILSALWAMARAWAAAGRPVNCPLMPRFEEWSKVVAAIVSHAGYGDCTVRAEIAGAGDEISDMRTLVEHLARDGKTEAQSSCEYDFDDLMAKIKELGLFDDVEVRGGRRDRDLWSDDGKVTRAGMSLFGKLFARYDRRVFATDGLAVRFLISGKGQSRRFVIQSE